jgi:hypothetical protein
MLGGVQAELPLVAEHLKIYELQYIPSKETN